MVAMADSHAAEIAAMSAKIASVSFASGVPQGAGMALRPPPGPVPSFPPAYGPSQYDLDEKARVASVKLQSILKPQSKKEKKAVP
jgi:hypothetical protein